MFFERDLAVADGESAHGCSETSMSVRHNEHGAARSAADSPWIFFSETDRPIHLLHGDHHGKREYLVNEEIVCGVDVMGFFCIEYQA